MVLKLCQVEMLLDIFLIMNRSSMFYLSVGAHLLTNMKQDSQIFDLA